MGADDFESQKDVSLAQVGITNRWRFLVSYDGTDFHGFAAQPGQRTIAGEISGALSRVIRLPKPPLLVCAGRTDAGVHARGQVIHADLPSTLPCTRDGKEMTAQDLARSITRQLGPTIVIRSATQTNESFDARRSATARTYRYLLFNSNAPDPLLSRLAWHVPERLTLRAMKSAADVLVGEHDFRAFCKRPPNTSPADPIVRRVREAIFEEIELDGQRQVLRFSITSSSFCQQMVRSIVGMLVAVGKGKQTPPGVLRMLRGGDRKGAPDPAPPHGLCLEEVEYGQTTPPSWLELPGQDK